jgi:Raf kinase inhibitor-like YbhB/YbcL family protein
VRRLALLTTSAVLVMIGAACRHDGRTLRPPKADQYYTISTLASTSTLPGDGTEAPFDSTVFGSGSDGTVDTAGITLPGGNGPYTVSAPWRDGAAIDARYTCDQLNVAPALSWSVAPAGTAEIAITMTDNDAPDFVHWAIAGLGPHTVALAENTVPIGAYQAKNGAGDTGYTGPCPPAGTSHTYQITVHYLSAPLGLTDGAAGADMIDAITAVEISSATTSGTFSRP